MYNYKDIIVHYDTWQFTLSNDSYLLIHRVMSLGPVLSRSVKYTHIRLSKTIYNISENNQYIKWYTSEELMLQVL